MGGRFVWALIALCGLQLGNLAPLPRAHGQTTTAVTQASAETWAATITEALSRGDTSAALKEAQEALAQYNSDPRLLSLAAVANAQLAHMDDALRLARKALKRQPDYLPANALAGQILFARDDASAEGYLRKVLAKAPGDPQANLMMEQVAFSQHRCQQEQAFATAAGPRALYDGEAFSRQGVCLAELGETDRAVALMRDGLARYPETTSLRYNLASTLGRAHRFEEVHQALAGGLASDTVNPKLLQLDAKLYLDDHHVKEAIDAYRRGIAADPKELSYYLDIAILCYRYSAIPQGIEILSFGIGINPGAADIFLARGVLYGQQNESNKSLADLQRASELDPHLEFLKTAEGLLAEQQSGSSKALPMYRQAVLQHPTSPLNQLMLAEALSKESADINLGAHSEALRHARAAVQLAPDLLPARLLLSRLLLQGGDTKGSEEQCKAALQLAPNDREVLFQELMIKRRTGPRSAVDEWARRVSESRARDEEASMGTPNN